MIVLPFTNGGSLYDSHGNLTEERHEEQVLRSYAYDAASRMVSGKTL
ncbi:MAG: RHS repeat protein [Lachnospiraceae bacterium]|nr:RHS repeat protein [Lachnospiraceae bacterium]